MSSSDPPRTPRPTPRDPDAPLTTPLTPPRTRENSRATRDARNPTTNPFRTETSSTPVTPRRPRPSPRGAAAGVVQPQQPSLSDLQRPHTWRGQRQPPVGARLLQILNYLSDEDVDRRRDWARELEEADAWVREQLESRDENCLGDETIALLHLAAAKIKTHRLNENYHYRAFMPLKIPHPDNMPKYAPRLRYKESQEALEFGVSGPDCNKSEIMPTLPSVPRPWRLVNDLWLTALERQQGLDSSAREAAIAVLASDGDLMVPPSDNARQTPRNNLSLLEESTYDRTLDSRGGLSGYMSYSEVDDGTSTTPLATGTYQGTLPSNSPTVYAIERGARRAGLQGALRQFCNTENQVIADISRILVLPGGSQGLDTQDLDVIRTKAGIGNGRPVKLPELPANQLQRINGKTDPQGFIANMAQFYRNTRPAHKAAYGFAMARLFGNSPDGVLYPSDEERVNPFPPNNLFHPFVWRGVSGYVHVRQDLLRKMRGLKRLFDRELSITPRKLITDMQAAWDLGHSGQQPGSLLHLVQDRDIKPAGHSASPIPGEDEQVNPGRPLPDTAFLEGLEMEWIRFLLNNSITKGMKKATLPRTGLFIVFSVRLTRIFEDPGDTLFPDADTSVGIEDLIAHMDKMKGPVQKTTFYSYDVKMFLERLAHQGRCRYTEDWRTYGQVQRPLPNYFPEHLVVWKPRGDGQLDPDKFTEDAIPKTPRFTDRRTWLDVVHGDPPGDTLDANIRNYFLCLAYRWGRSMEKLEYAEPAWETMAPLPARYSTEGIRELRHGYKDHEGCYDRRQLKKLWRRTLNKPDEESLPVDENGVTVHPIKLIRTVVIDEVVRADNLLYPGRTTDYRDPLAPKTRESIWDWAKPAIRGKAKQFFSLDRWPVELQTAETQVRIRDDVDVDPQQLWNPIVEDPTPWTYYRPKARPYGDERVRFRAGHRLFPIGDTARQREVVKNQVMTMVGRAMGVVPDPSADDESLLGKVKSLLFRKRQRTIDNPDDDEEDEDLAPRHKLPRVDPALYPKRVDRVALAEALKAAHADATRPVRVPADQVPADAEDVDNMGRTAPNYAEALVVEQNMPLGAS
ncbi:unnamed protein product [Discula destructiva]